MAQATRKRVILFKIEPTYGVDAVPVPADAVLCSNMSLTPLEGSAVARDFIRPYFGVSGAIRIENFVSLSFDTEISGSGSAVGVAPEWGSLLKASNFSETATTAAIAGACSAAGTVTTIVLAAASSAVDDFYTGMSISIVAGAGIGQNGEIISYVGTTKVATIAVPWLVAPAITASTYSISPSVIYTPNSNFGTTAANTSATIYFNVDGVRHIMLGARGTFSLDLSAKSIPKMKWKFTGLMGVVSDQALPAADYTGWVAPVTVSAANTTDINILGYVGAVVQGLTFDIANTVIHRQLIGAESILITDRKPSGTVSIEATSVATKDWWTAAKVAAQGPISVQHGQTAGNVFSIFSPKAQIKDPKYSDSDGVNMIEFGVDLIPFGAAGNDEIRICSK